MKIVDSINSNGAAGSWAAEQLEADAKRLGTTMAALFSVTTHS